MAQNIRSSFDPSKVPCHHAVEVELSTTGTWLRIVLGSIAFELKFPSAQNDHSLEELEAHLLLTAFSACLDSCPSDGLGHVAHGLGKASANVLDGVRR